MKARTRVGAETVDYAHLLLNVVTDDSAEREVHDPYVASTT
jgi:hypothetical protein